MIFDFSNFLINHTGDNTFEGNCNCRMAAYLAQDGCCYVTGRIYQEGNMQLHHRQPRYYGGKDTPENLILLSKDVHKLIHSQSWRKIDSLLATLKLTEEEFRFVNQLRFEAHRYLLKPQSQCAA